MIRKTVQVKNRLGLHARAAAKLVRVASRYSSDVFISREGARQQIDSKSILGILMLAATPGTRLELSIAGQDEKDATEAIVQLFEDRFGEQGVSE
jgi:phosphocarrier protein HPr